MLVPISTRSTCATGRRLYLAETLASPASFHWSAIQRLQGTAVRPPGLPPVVLEPVSSLFPSNAAIPVLLYGGPDASMHNSLPQVTPMGDRGWSSYGLLLCESAARLFTAALSRLRTPNKQHTVSFHRVGRPRLRHACSLEHTRHGVPIPNPLHGSEMMNLERMTPRRAVESHTHNPLCLISSGPGVPPGGG